MIQICWWCFVCIKCKVVAACIGLGVVIFQQEIKMGCGAICGDTMAIDTINSKHSQKAFQQLLPHLNKNSPLVSKQALSSFIRDYMQNTSLYHLSVKSHLIKDQTWKIVLFCLDSEQKAYCDCLGLTQVERLLQEQDGQANIANQIMQQTLIFHDCFIQIEKDLQRTFKLPPSRKQQFENVLKRIANYFPKMGYTQGINFIIGYLIIIGYSQNDSFWIFVHIAINRRYLLLGLYQDGFPLSNIFTIVFKNVLKRKQPVLYDHLFLKLFIDPSMWVFKWFITCYLYSFPIQMIMYIWDYLISVGCMGIVTFAVALTLQLSDTLMLIDQLSDISQFFQSLRELDIFNNHINLKRVFNIAYQLKILASDFQGISDIKGFYGDFFNNLSQQTLSNQRKQEGLPIKNNSEQAISFSQQSMHKWNKFKSSSKSGSVVDMRLGLESNTKSFKRHQDIKDDLEMVIFEVEEPKTIQSSSQLPPKPPRRNNLQIKKQKQSKNIVLDIFPISKNEIIQGFDQQNSSIASKKKHSIKFKQLEFDELDKLQRQFTQKGNVKFNNYSAPDIKQKQIIKQQKSSTFQCIKMHQDPVMSIESNTFAIVGNNILKIDNYDLISVSSKHTNKRSVNYNNQKGIIPKNNSRICGCKIKTQENKQVGTSSIDRNSDMEESKDQFSDKDSIYNNKYFHNQEAINDTRSIRNMNIDTVRQRLSTQNDYMINSQGPSLKEKLPSHTQLQMKKIETDIQVEVLPFKKDKKRKINRIPNLDTNKRENKEIVLNLEGHNDEQSLESIVAKVSRVVSQYSCQCGKECIGSCCSNSYRKEFGPNSSRKQCVDSCCKCIGGCGSGCEIESIR